MRLMIAVTALGLIVAAPASAQFNGGPAQSTARMDRFTQQMSEHALDSQTGSSSETHNPRRIRRAERAAELINNGDCDGARALAVRERDNRLAARIDQVCATPATAGAAAGAAPAAPEAATPQ